MGREDEEWKSYQECPKCEKENSFCKCMEGEKLRKEYKEIGLL